MDFEIFKSNICHEVKSIGDIEYLIKIMKSNEIQDYFEKNELLECFYLLGMIDYLCKENNLPFNSKYNYIRQYKLEKQVFPRGVLVLASIYNNDEPCKEALKECIPEFLRYNIVEAEVRNVF